MKKVYVLLAAWFVMVASAFAEGIAINPDNEYQLSLKIDATGGGNIYAKAYAGADASYIETYSDNLLEGARLSGFSAGQSTISGKLEKPYGGLTSVDRVLFTMPWTQAGTYTISDIKIVDAEGNDLMSDVSFTNIECTFIVSGNPVCTLGEDGRSFSITLDTYVEGHAWCAQFLLTIEAGDATAVDETSAPVISAVNGTVYCDTDFVIYNMIGVEVTGQNGSLNGNYIVVANGESVVVNVK